MSNRRIPFGSLTTLFVDVGNTLVSLDFDGPARWLRARGFTYQAEGLHRAEAAARPAVSRALGQLKSTEGAEAFTFYLHRVLERLPAWPADHSATAEMARELAAELAARGKPRIWSRVLPGAPGALAAFRRHGLRLFVVSNSDGTVEEVLDRLDLRGHFDGVLDSHVIGYEKPDPRIFQCALERAGANPNQTLHVGDLYHVDVVGAERAGIHALLLDPFDDWHDVDCERARDLADLSHRLQPVSAEPSTPSAP